MLFLMISDCSIMQPNPGADTRHPVLPMPGRWSSLRIYA